MTDSNDIIDFVNKKLKSEIDILNLSIWEQEQVIEQMKDGIKDKKEENVYRRKQIAVLEHAITVLEGKKDKDVN